MKPQRLNTLLLILLLLASLPVAAWGAERGILAAYDGMEIEF